MSLGWRSIPTGALTKKKKEEGKDLKTADDCTRFKVVVKIAVIEFLR